MSQKDMFQKCDLQELKNVLQKLKECDDYVHSNHESVKEVYNEIVAKHDNSVEYSNNYHKVLIVLKNICKEAFERFQDLEDNCVNILSQKLITSNAKFQKSLKQYTSEEERKKHSLKSECAIEQNMQTKTYIEESTSEGITKQKTVEYKLQNNGKDISREDQKDDLTKSSNNCNEEKEAKRNENSTGFIRLVSLEKLLDPNIAALQKGSKSHSSCLSSNVIVLDSDDESSQKNISTGIIMNIDKNNEIAIDTSENENSKESKEKTSNARDLALQRQIKIINESHGSVSNLGKVVVRIKKKKLMEQMIKDGKYGIKLNNKASIYTFGPSLEKTGDKIRIRIKRNCDQITTVSSSDSFEEHSERGGNKINSTKGKEIIKFNSREREVVKKKVVKERKEKEAPLSPLREDEDMNNLNIHTKTETKFVNIDIKSSNSSFATKEAAKTKKIEKMSFSSSESENLTSSSPSQKSAINSSSYDKYNSKNKKNYCEMENTETQKKIADTLGDVSDNSSSSDSVVVRKKRKKASSSSESKTANNDCMDSDNNKSDNENKKKKSKKRRRICNNDSESSGTEEDSPNKKRKNIRKLIKTKDLLSDTKKATKEEEERRKRIQERQILQKALISLRKQIGKRKKKIIKKQEYNQIYDKAENVELKEVILDFDEESKKPLLSVDSALIKKLKPHQALGIKFMWDACFETLKDIKNKSGSGCILAHCMGLGKTLQIVSLTHTLLTNKESTAVERVVIIAPLSTLNNWAKEYFQWMKFCKKKDVEVYDMSRWREKNLRIHKVKEWFEEGGVLIIGYDMFRILSNPKCATLKKKQREFMQKCLVDPGPDLVVCDEGHLLKNEKTSLSQSVNRMKTKRRIVLTGTPLQNNLKEYYCMIQFIKPNLLGTYKEYLNRFVNPITNGQYTDSTARDIQLMKHRSHVLHKLLEGCIQRQDYSVLAPYLPPKYEYVVFITLSEMQKKLYDFYMTKQRDIITRTQYAGKGALLFQDFQNLRRIWTHPMCLRVNSDLVIKKRLAKDFSESEGSLRDFIDDEDEDDKTSISTSSSSSESSNEDNFEESVHTETRFSTRSTRRNPNAGNGNSNIEEKAEAIEEDDPSEWWKPLCSEGELNNINHSHKLILLMEILQSCESIGDKVLLFSQSLQSLDVIEKFLALIDNKTQNDEDFEGNIDKFKASWTIGVDYFRLDGSSTVENREVMCRNFNDVNNLRARLFLISTRAGSLGINLVAANRVIIFDVSWNPSHDTQSIFRVYRFGQEKPCYIYRFISWGTMEQKVYERQVAKQATAKRVVDEQQIGRHYNQSDLLELYKYELEPSQSREIPVLPKDRLFADLLTKYEKLIYQYHEHDSLLENEESENLTEDERKAAWAEYQAEKERPAQQYMTYNRPSYGNSNGPVTSNKLYGFRTDILLRLLNVMVRQDHPTLNDNEVFRMVPAYLQRLDVQMNNNDLSMYRRLIEMHRLLEVPQGSFAYPTGGYGGNTGLTIGINPTTFMQQNTQQQSDQFLGEQSSNTSAQIYEID